MKPGSRLAQRLEQAWADDDGLAGALRPLAALYGVLLRVRGWLYRQRILKTAALPVPVIVVGNLIAGGAGKTPTVMALCALLRRRGCTPAIVSRGYGGSEAQVAEVTPESIARDIGDEPLLLRLRCRVPVFVGRDRVAAARALLEAYPRVDVLISDDGLQHLRLPRRVQIIVFDERGAANGQLLPAGPLREPLPAEPPPRTLVLYNHDRPSTPLHGALATRSLAGLVELPDWLAGARPSFAPLDELAGRRIVAAAGIARPERFFAMLREAGLDIEPLPLPDHHDFATPPWPAGTADVIVTEKDAVKLDAARTAGARVWVAGLDFGFAPEFETRLIALLGDPT